MPTYTFKNSETQEVYEVFLKISELDEYKTTHPTHELQISNVATLDPIRMGRIKPSAEFRETMQKIALTTPGGKGLLDRIR